MSFWTLAAVCFVTSLAATGLALAEERAGHSRLAFDLLRAIAITTLGWAVIAAATILDPVRMGAAVYVPPTVMATATFLAFLVQAIGWACFVAFRWQSLTGRHPWERTAPWVALVLLVVGCTAPAPWVPPDPRPRMWGCLNVYDPAAPLSCETPRPRPTEGL